MVKGGKEYLMEQRLLEQAKRGDPASFDQLVEVHTPSLYRVVRRHASDRGEAESIVQEAWFRVWKALDRSRTDQPFFPWLVFSIYTFPASILMLLILFTFAALGIVSITFQIGRWFLNRVEWNLENPLISLGLGTFLIFSAIRIPFLGILFLPLVGFTGFGAALSTRFGSGTKWTPRPLVEEEL